MHVHTYRAGKNKGMHTHIHIHTPLEQISSMQSHSLFAFYFIFCFPKWQQVVLWCPNRFHLLVIFFNSTIRIRSLIRDRTTQTHGIAHTRIHWHKHTRVTAHTYTHWDVAFKRTQIWKHKRHMDMHSNIHAHQNAHPHTHLDVHIHTDTHTWDRLLFIQWQVLMSLPHCDKGIVFPVHSH